MGINVLTKALGGIQDLLFGQGSQTQTRNGVDYNISRIELTKPLATLNDLKALDVTDPNNYYPYAKTYGNIALGDIAPVDWWFDVTEPIASDNGSTIIAGNGATVGCWKDDSPNVFLTTVLEIGDWDMLTDAFVNVPHTLDYTKVRSLTAIIRNDSNGIYYDINKKIGTETGASGIDIIDVSIGLNRSAGGIFDNTGYNATGYNRGWITIKHIA